MSHGVYTLLAAAAASTVVLGLLVLGYVRARRSAPRAAHGDVNSVVSELTSRVDELAADLQRALERAEREGRRGRFLGELSISIDLDEVLARTVDAAAALGGVEAAVVSIQDAEQREIVAATGIALEEAEGQSFSQPPDGDVDAVLLGYRYAGRDEGRIQSALAVPLRWEEGRLGWIAVYSRTSNRALDEEIGADLHEIAGRAGPALSNALRFREARRLADLDALTGLHNRRYFHETLAREVARAHRYGRRLALVVLDLDDFKSINERIGHLAGDGVLAEAAERLRTATRQADIACRVGGDEFAVILPEAGIGQADQLYRRIDAAVGAKPVGQVSRVGISAGVAELNENDDANSLFERADDALYRAKDAGKARVFPALAPEPPGEANTTSA